MSTTFSLVIPVFKNEASLPDLMDACSALARALKFPLEVVCVVDGSPDDCAAWLREHLPRQPFRSQLCEHSRNFGSFAAIRTGLALATGDVFAVMAADLQEPITLAQTFFEKLASGEVDVAIGVRAGRVDDSISSRIFWGLYRRFIIREVPAGGVDMFGCSREARDTLVSLHERNSSLIGQLFWIGYRRVQVQYERQARKHGVSAWTFSRKVNYLLDSVYSFSDLPIRLLMWLGVGSLGTAALAGLLVLVARLTGQIEVPGYTATILAVMFFGGLNSLGLGVIGEYVWRTFENTKGRPVAISTRKVSFPGTIAELAKGVETPGGTATRT